MLEGIKPEEDVCNRVIALAFHEALGEGARRVELASREIELEGLVKDVLIGRVLGKGAPVIKHGVIIIPRGTRDVPGKIAPKQGIDFRNFGPRGWPAPVRTES